MFSLYPIIDAWKSPQVKLQGVVRWRKYLNKARRQNTLQHSHSITLLGIMVLAELRSFIDLDEALVLSALALHDVGEGEVGSDTLYIDKTKHGDVNEYLAFRNLYREMKPGVLFSLKKAFLLQFCLSDYSEFPEEAQRIMDSLKKEKKFEALAFEAIERLDYILYAVEQWENGNQKILVQTLRHQLEKIDSLAENLPGFRKIWTKKISVWSENFLEQNQGLWIEEKSKA
jgi:5'-deoxynucleotidase YfbR-like HD superfamily hydrolase